MPRFAQFAARLSALTLLLAGCSIPFHKSSDERKAECDRISARAIQAEKSSEAKDIAAEASACYARIQ
jgi:hypothetical protein